MHISLATIKKQKEFVIACMYLVCRIPVCIPICEKCIQIYKPTHAVAHACQAQFLTYTAHAVRSSKNTE